MTNCLLPPVTPLAKTKLLSGTAAWLMGVSVFAQAASFDYHSVRGREEKGPPNGVIEGEQLLRKGTARVQKMDNKWSGEAHLLWNGKIGECSDRNSYPSQYMRQRCAETTYTS